MSTVSVAVWGLGPHAVRKILPAIAASPRLRLRGVCSRRADRVEAQAELWRCQGWADPGQMLEDREVDAVFVATPIGLHAEHGRAVLRAGKHLWCEKPLATRLDAALELFGIAERKGLSVCEGMMYLHHPHFDALKHAVTSGRLGMVLSVGSRFGIPRLDYGSFRSDPALGGGALFDVGCYPISAIHTLFPDDARVVTSRVDRRGGSAVDSDGTTVLELADGATAHLEWRINCAYRNEITIWGTEGSVTTHQIFSKPPTYVPELEFRDLRGVATIETSVAADHFMTMLQSFADVTNGKSDGDAERTRVVRTVRIMDEIWTGSEK
jgi:predicted dehydrogenase